jgi:hypothetical protein
VRDQLPMAWSRLGIEDLLALVRDDLGWAGWVVRGTYLRGPCPQQRGEKCSRDPTAAFIYARPSGKTPWCDCNHRHSCGFSESLFALVADAKGSKADAAAVIKSRAGIVNNRSTKGLSARRMSRVGPQPLVITRRTREVPTTTRPARPARSLPTDQRLASPLPIDCESIVRFTVQALRAGRTEAGVQHG